MSTPAVLAYVDGRLRRAHIARMGPRRNEECSMCLNVGRLLMPVRICAGSIDPEVIFMCYTCRTGWRDDDWACLASTVEHGKELLKCPECNGTGTVEGQIPNRYDPDYMDDVPLVCECQHNERRQDG